ncbi:30S ribosomal protein S7 [Candidatus Giovannonibacteria bacterium RIFCSPLOWO2_01_FULL_44_40]|uniref:Small ribosomal subunit protein uS7 n=1 Tax=Candidatus Giovannonibacteria bacterium RIFCSPHIGHO2_01_FULL_45_23 TaxID=1798325 RepID=A0A1F5VJ51_9BACT|nr:MAG: 30S ribosomal protein S7 [Candidatus Giovannonibacteria bacterium RIFCSPHIGHO2_01_FULL_45_23]OGF76812.1 MAG: 30S ribosomal protein S7 [Candidatus Giovannonibacteria bacterium RIFCSPHIGHO2_02_FULL_45_13]OGF79736.1 MAG: 30S ribosomal protein S7 [Candidatus Giovannonibacteria bacterium RIFCSPLOWO2_01_FULL_44_40]
MRRKKKEKRELVPDPVYDSALVAKLTNYLMFSGKKSTAQKVIWGALEEIKKIEKKGETPVIILERAIKNITPLVEIRPRRIGGATYQVPREVQPDRGFALAARWLIGAARAKKGKPMAKKLAEEVLFAAKNEGAAIKKKLDTHRMAEANRAFAHFAW